jgi:hypothetical protein
MAGNDLTNASFLDGTGGWTAVGGALSVNENGVRGGKGRAVLVSTRTATAGQTAGARSDGVAVASGALIEVAALYGSTSENVEAALAIYSGATLLSRTVIPRQRLAEGACRQGAPETLNFAYAQMTAGATGDAKIEVLATAAGSGVIEAWLSKPYLDGTYEPRKHYVWDPGEFDNVDLAGFRRWPALFPPVLLEGYNATPTPIRDAFSGDAQREESRRLAGMPATRMNGRFKLTRAQLADLQDFHRDSDAPFLFVRPDTAELCKATWLKDGDPTSEPNGLGEFYVTIGLQLVVL